MHFSVVRKQLGVQALIFNFFSISKLAESLFSVLIACTLGNEDEKVVKSVMFRQIIINF